MWSGGRWFCEDRKDWSAERSPWCICCWTCKCDNSRTSWSPGKFFHQFFNSASMQWHFKLREPASDAEMKVDIAAANFLWIIWYLVDLLFSNGIITWLGSRITFLSVDGGGSLFSSSRIWFLLLKGNCSEMVLHASSPKERGTNYCMKIHIVASMPILMRRHDRFCWKLIICLN